MRHDIDFFMQLEKNLNIDFKIKAQIANNDKDDKESLKKL